MLRSQRCATDHFELERAYRRLTGLRRISRVARRRHSRARFWDPIKPEDVVAVGTALGEQPCRVAGLMTGAREVAWWDGPAVPYEWTDVLAAVERVRAVVRVPVRIEALAVPSWHHGRCAAFILPDGTPFGFAGELHPRVLETLGLPARTVGFELVLDPLVALSEGAIAAAVPVAAHPLAKEDFAFVVPVSLAATDLVRVVHGAGGELVESARVFDVYAGAQVGEGLKSVAVNVVMRASDRTLSAEDVLAVRQAIIAAAEREFGAVLR